MSAPDDRSSERTMEAHQILRTNIFHPDHKKPLKWSKCVWAVPPGSILPSCISQVALRDVYKSFGESRLERYFVARGVPAKLTTAMAYLDALDVLFDAAEDLGWKWRTATHPESVLVACGHMTLPAETFLAEVWQALVDIYRGMAALCPGERAALQPFSMAEPRIIVPLRCPDGGPFCGITVAQNVVM